MVTIDETWLGDPGRVWPVVVDPTLTQIDGSADDTFVTPYVTTDRSTLGYVYAGSLGMFFNRSYLHLDTTAVAGKVIHFADFNADYGYAPTPNLPFEADAGAMQTIDGRERLVAAGMSGATPVIVRYRINGQ